MNNDFLNDLFNVLIENVKDKNSLQKRTLKIKLDGNEHIMNVFLDKEGVMISASPISSAKIEEENKKRKLTELITKVKTLVSEGKYEEAWNYFNQQKSV